MRRQAILGVALLCSCGRVTGPGADGVEASTESGVDIGVLDSSALDSALAETSSTDSTIGEAETSAGAELALEALGPGARLLGNVGVACAEKRCFVTLVQYEPFDYGKGALTCPAPTKTVLLGYDGGALSFSKCIDDIVVTDIAADGSGAAVAGYQRLATGRSAVVAQFGLAGDLVWKKVYAASGAKATASARSISIDPTSHDVVVALDQTGAVDFGGSISPGSCSLARISSKGAVQWAQGPTAGVPAPVASSGVAGTVTSLGAVLVTPAVGSVTIGAVSSSDLGSGELGLAIIRFDAKGLAQQVRAFHAETGLLSAVKVRADSTSAYVLGYAGGKLQIKDGCQGSFVVAFDLADLSPKWLACWPDSEPGGGLLLGDVSLAVGGGVLDKTESRAFVRRYSKSGVLLDSFESVPGKNRVTDVAVQSGGVVVLGGYFSSPLSFPAVAGKPLSGRTDLPGYAGPAFLGRLSP